MTFEAKVEIAALRFESAARKQPVYEAWQRVRIVANYSIMKLFTVIDIAKPGVLLLPKLFKPRPTRATVSLSWITWGWTITAA